MPHLDNDMDELFQKAGEYYSPQKGDGDWESIVRRIASKSDRPKVAAPKNKRTKIVLILTLLLIGLSIGGYMFKNNMAGIFYSNKAGGLSKYMADDPVSSQIKNNNGQLPPVKTLALQTSKNRNVSSVKSLNTSSLHSNILIEWLNEKKPGNDLANESHIDFVFRQNFKEKASEALLKDLINDKKEFSEQLKFFNQKLTNHVFINSLQGQEDYRYAITKNNKKEPGNIIPKNKKFYLGFVAGLDFSKVQARPFHYPKYAAGVIFGLRSHSRISFETGAILGKKNYKSEGRYFKMGKVQSGMPGGMIINDLEGQSSLIEIPIKVKYDIISKRSADIFIAGGISSYLMIKEKNVYNVTLNGDHQTITAVYNNNHFQLPAVANISLGYEHGISKNLQVRVEPFIKIPLRGIGVGSLPVTSAGLQVGFTHRLK